jgi:hypothetical protein
MILRTLTFAAGLAGAAGASQFPEFSQQYAQRLGGAVDELARVVAELDRDAAAVELDRQTALAQLERGGDFGAARAASLRRTVARHRDLSADLAALDGAGPFTRARLLGRMTDPEIARRTWAAYRPALPLTFEGAIFAALGFAIGAAGLAGIAGLGRTGMRRIIG